MNDNHAGLSKVQSLSMQRCLLPMQVMSFCLVIFNDENLFAEIEKLVHIY